MLKIFHVYLLAPKWQYIHSICETVPLWWVKINLLNYNLPQVSVLLSTIHRQQYDLKSRLFSIPSIRRYLLGKLESSVISSRINPLYVTYGGHDLPKGLIFLKNCWKFFWYNHCRVFQPFTFRFGRTCTVILRIRVIHTSRWQSYWSYNQTNSTDMLLFQRKPKVQYC